MCIITHEFLCQVRSRYSVVPLAVPYFILAFILPFVFCSVFPFIKTHDRVEKEHRMRTRVRSSCSPGALI